MAEPERRSVRRERSRRQRRPIGRPKRAVGTWPARARLLKVAARIFAAKGYAAASVAEIVAGAGVTKPVLYYHFQNKEGLFRGLMNEAALLLDTTIRNDEQEVGTARARLRHLYGDLFDLFVANLDIARFLDAVMYGPPQGAPPFDLEKIHDRLRAVVRRLVRDGLRSGEFRRGREEDIMWGLLGIIRIATETHSQHPERSPGRTGMLRLLSLFLDGLATGRAAKGRSR